VAQLPIVQRRFQTKDMKVFKFGGASVKDATAIKNVAAIIAKYRSNKLLVVISATGKTTNALEEVVQAYYHENGDATALLNGVRETHFTICRGLFDSDTHPVYDQLQNILAEVEWQIEEDRKDSYNYVYDQIVSVGELLSTAIVSHYLNHIGAENQWLDVRDVMKTDDTYREGKVDWEKTQSLVDSIVMPMLDKSMIITQGFIGSTPENCTATLGREGSDYSAAIFANMLNAESQTIWKDVPGVLSADPRKFPDAVMIDELTYLEAVEMTYYGAQVIHPKTIKPLQNKGIPLLVKSFINPEGKGTKVYTGSDNMQYPPVRVVKEKQALLSFHTKDFSFIADEEVIFLLKAFGQANLRANMMQNGAISIQICCDNVPEKIVAVKEATASHFNIQEEEGLTLMTIRHYNEEVINRHTAGKSALLEQRRPSTFQALLK
jgi:aspartate kinase